MDCPATGFAASTAGSWRADLVPTHLNRIASVAPRKIMIVPPKGTSVTRSFKVWFGGLLVTVWLASISVIWLDKPVAILINDKFGPRHLPDTVVRSPGLSIPLASALLFVIFGLSAIIGRRLSKLETSVLLCSISA